MKQRTDVPDGHPRDATLAKFSDGKLDAAALRDVAEHLEQCPDCVERLGKMSREISGSNPILQALRASGDEAETIDTGISGIPDDDGFESNPFASSEGSAATLDETIAPVSLHGSSVNDLILRSQTDEAGLEQHPKYQVLGEIARGGMGAVLQGRDRTLGRDLAIKVLLHQHDTDRGLAKRFVEEAQIGSQLQHPGIAPIYEMGRLDDKRPYFTMKLVKGETFASRLQHRDPTMTGTEKESEMMSLLQTISSVCQTVGYAHSRGVIHRVLKPSNIMVGAFGEVQVMDWGLAKVLRRGGAADDHPPIAEDATPDSAALSEEIQISAAPLQTMAGSLLGTPAYMAPEQATGENATFDERADVFAIGAMLCEVLSGHPPFSNADGVTQTLIAARSGDLTAAFKALDQCDADTQLIQITKECLSPDRNHRPRTAGGVSRKLVKQFEAVQTRLRLATEEKVRADEKVRAALQRRRLWAGLTASLLAVTVVAVFAAVIFRKQQQQRCIEPAV
ncbi:MAG: protein kinase, partial [Planctomycetota bacterium]